MVGREVAIREREQFTQQFNLEDGYGSLVAYLREMQTLRRYCISLSLVQIEQLTV
jgi:hypothetical protein